VCPATSSSDPIAPESKSIPAEDLIVRSLEAAWAPAWVPIRDAFEAHERRVLPGTEAADVVSDLHFEVDVLKRILRAYLRRWSQDLIDESAAAAEKWVEFAWGERERLRGGPAGPRVSRKPENGAAAEFDARLGGDP